MVKDQLLENHESSLEEMNNELGEFVNYEMEQTDEPCDPSTVETNEIVTDMTQEEKVKGTHPDIKRSYKVSDLSVEDHPVDSLENRSSSHEVATKSLRVRIKENDAGSCGYSEYDPRSNKDKGDTSIRTNLEEDIHNSEYHSGDPEVATIYKLDKNVTTAHVGIDGECQTMESTKLSSNRWEDSYCEIEGDRSEERD